jgi:hypothetical protein
VVSAGASRRRSAAGAGAGGGGARPAARPAAPHLEALMDDTEPEPRRDAAIALAALGPTGLLLLKDVAEGPGTPGMLARAVLEAEEGRTPALPTLAASPGGAAA